MFGLVVGDFIFLERFRQGFFISTVLSIYPVASMAYRLVWNRGFGCEGLDEDSIEGIFCRFIGCLG